MQPMLTLPILVGAILVTAVLSSIITASLPMVPVWWNALKSDIKHLFMRKPSENKRMDLLEQQMDSLSEQVHNVAKKMTNRESNRKVQVKKIVREYLEELSK